MTPLPSEQLMPRTFASDAATSRTHSGLCGSFASASCRPSITLHAGSQRSHQVPVDAFAAVRHGIPDALLRPQPAPTSKEYWRQLVDWFIEPHGGMTSLWSHDSSDVKHSPEEVGDGSTDDQTARCKSQNLRSRASRSKVRPEVGAVRTARLLRNDRTRPLACSIVAWLTSRGTRMRCEADTVLYRHTQRRSVPTYLGPIGAVEASGGGSASPPWLESWVGQHGRTRQVVRFAELSDGFSVEAAHLAKHRRSAYQRVRDVQRSQKYRVSVRLCVVERDCNSPRRNEHGILVVAANNIDHVFVRGRKSADTRGSLS